MLERMTGSGNGNKMNMRISILESILNKETENSNDGTSARVNSLRQVIKKNKTDMAEDAVSSLDLMRKIFQGEISREIHQIIERHIRTTFTPAIENLKRNGHVVDEDVINTVYVNVLEAAKKPFVKNIAGDNGKMSNDALENCLKRGYESDESDVSVVSHSSEAKRRRGRPRKDEEAYRLEMTPPTINDVVKWNPDRITFASRYVQASKVAACLSIPVSILFNKFPRLYRYSCDEDDKNQLAEEKRTIRAPGRCYLMNIDDVKLIVPSISLAELSASAFPVNELLMSKMRQKAVPMFEKLKACLPPTPF